MNEHVEKWLAAYHDGELSGQRLRQVEVHLETCEACLVELETLGRLRNLLQLSPEPEGLLPSELFVSQVGLRLTRGSERAPLRQSLGLAWRIVPVFLLAGWAFFQTLIQQNGLMRLLRGLGIWMDLDTLSTSTPLNQFALSIGLSAVFGLAILSWLASWWMREQHKLLEN